MSGIRNRDLLRCYGCAYVEVIFIWNAHPFGCPQCGSSAVSHQNYLTSEEARELGEL